MNLAPAIPSVEHLGIGFATKQIWRTVQRHRRLFICWFVAVLAICVVTLSLLKPIYTATAIVAISPQATDPLAPAGQQTADFSEDDYLSATIASMMQARGVVTAVLAQYPAAMHPASHLQQLFCSKLYMFCSGSTPEDPVLQRQTQIDQFLESLSVTPQPHSGIIDITVDAPSASRAAQLANSVVRNYQRIALEQQINQSNTAANWLVSRTADLRQRWITAIGTANSYSVQHNLTEASDGSAAAPLVDEQMGDVAASLTLASSALAAAEAKAGASSSSNFSNAGSSALNPSDGAALLGLENQRGQMAGEFGPQYPKLKALNDEIAALRGTQDGQVGASTEPAEHIAVAQAEVAELTNKLNRLQAQAVVNNSQQATYQSLLAEAASAHAAYTTFLEHTNETTDRTVLFQPPVTFVSEAGLPTRPSFPDIPKVGLGVLFLALVAGVGAVLVGEHLSEDFAAADDLRAFVNVPVLTSIPLLVGQSDHAIAKHVLSEPLSRTSEAVRRLAASLSLVATNGDGPRCVVLTSAGAFEGKSTLAVWLAATVRRSGERVLLIDGDHRRGKLLHDGGAARLGLTDLLAGEVRSEAVIQHDPDTGVDFIAGGTLAARPFGSHDIAKLRDIIAGLKKSYNMIVIDSPPLMAMVDGFVLGTVADQTVLVCRWHHTSRNAVRASLNRLQNYGANVAGIAVSMVDQNAAFAFDGHHSKREYDLIKRLYGT